MHKDKEKYRAPEDKINVISERNTAQNKQIQYSIYNQIYSSMHISRYVTTTSRFFFILGVRSSKSAQICAN